MRKRENAMRFLSPFVLSFLALLSSSKMLAQRADWRSRVDEKVQRADSLSLKSQKIFYLNKYLGKDKPIKETWYYTMQNGKILIFEIKYVSDSTEFSEIYYLDNGSLICMEEYQVSYLSIYTDQVKHGAAMFFDNQDLRQFVVTGKDKGEIRWSTGYVLLKQFDKRFEELKKTIQYEPPRN
jgi:hypothetical protein